MRNSNGTGSIFKLSGKRRNPYIIRGAAFKINDKYVRKIIGKAPTLKKANEILNEYNSKLGKLSNEEITLKNLFEKWKDSKHAKSIKTEDTLNRYINTFENTFKSILKLNFIELGYKDYQPLLENIPKTTGKVALTVLKSIYLDALKNEIIKSDFTILLEASNIVTRKVQRVVFKDEFVRYLWIKYNETEEEKYGIILILFYTGMRAIDLIRVQNININLSERYLITGSKTKAGMNRKIPIHYLIYPIIKKYKNNSINLFNISSTNTLNKTFNRIIQEYDINMKGNLHSIRHTFITKMQQLQIKVSIIKNIVGHEEKNVTDGVYTHWSIKDLRDAINRLKY